MFRWCSYLGVPFSYQQHGIVIAVEGGDEKESNETAGTSDNIGGQNITIVNFDHQQDNVEKEKNRCASTVQIIDQDKNQAEWEQVQYSETEWHKRLSSRAGTCSPDNADPVPVVMSRIRFLQVHSGVMITSLQYDTHKRNGECIAIWCKTGVYKSLAGSAKMGEPGMHVGTFSVVGGIAAQLAVSVVVPVVLPFMAAMDVGHAITSAKDLSNAKQEWNERTVEWNGKFEEYITKQNEKQILWWISTAKWVRL